MASVRSASSVPARRCTGTAPASPAPPRSTCPRGTTSWTFSMPAAGFPADDSYTVHARATDNVGLTSGRHRRLHARPHRTGRAHHHVRADRHDRRATTRSPSPARPAPPSSAASTRVPSRLAPARGAYGVLADGSHTFDVRAVDRAGNTGALPGAPGRSTRPARRSAPRSPCRCAIQRHDLRRRMLGRHRRDICGSTSDSPSGVAKVEISLQRASTGLYLSGATFSSASQTWIIATGTTSWRYAFLERGFRRTAPTRWKSGPPTRSTTSGTSSRAFASTARSRPR